jgi:hypothetical protein
MRTIPIPTTTTTAAAVGENNPMERKKGGRHRIQSKGNCWGDFFAFILFPRGWLFFWNQNKPPSHPKNHSLERLDAEVFRRDEAALSGFQVADQLPVAPSRFLQPNAVCLLHVDLVRARGGEIVPANTEREVRSLRR